MITIRYPNLTRLVSEVTHVVLGTPVKTNTATSAAAVSLTCPANTMRVQGYSESGFYWSSTGAATVDDDYEPAGVFDIALKCDVETTFSMLVSSASNTKLQARAMGFAS
jgi:hypothetical protein